VLLLVLDSSILAASHLPYHYYNAPHKLYITNLGISVTPSTRPSNVIRTHPICHIGIAPSTNLMTKGWVSFYFYSTLSLQVSGIRWYLDVALNYTKTTNQPINDVKQLTMRHAGELISENSV